ncbi:hypothetical protein GWK47_008632 [Chionoecetes opilio]|uniref:Uncharacterized protein n=1 Tax=Chionoecetes opilio TaxID=41210 RepID=A0A8J4XXI0_CHIOP|nr:hypothetical protein GWK47_008632 [Chionoecetes opilio]
MGSRLGRSSFMFGGDMGRKDMSFGPSLQSEMQQLKRQLDFVNQKYENEKLKRELLEKEKALDMERAAMLSSQGGNYNSGMAMLNSPTYGGGDLDNYQQGLKRDSMTMQDNWDLKRQRY